MKEMRKKRKIGKVREMNGIKKIRQGFLFLGALIFSICPTPLLADIPAPPSSDYASGSSDWITTDANMGFKLIGYVVLFIAISAGIAAISGMVSAYYTMQVTNNTRHFTLSVIAGMFLLAASAGIAYATWQLLPSS